MEDGSEVRRFQGTEADAFWRELLTGETKVLQTLGRLFQRIPSAPRCKLCRAPFHGPVAPLFRLVGFRRWALNQQLCKFCFTHLDKIKGGTEVPVSLLFADVRGSTTLAEQMSAGEFSTALDEFFEIAFEAVDSEDGVIDHIVGDGVMALWVPAFVGTDHPKRAVAAGRRLRSALASVSRLGDSFPVGIGVHTGTAFVGVVGKLGSYDFTVLGDVPNTVARLGSAAQGGELVMSDDIVAAAGVDTTGLERRMLQLKGKTEMVPSWVEKAEIAVE